MSTFMLTLTESLRYRGREGQMLFLGHRLAGLGTLLFLAIHIVDTSMVYFSPPLYEEAIAIYRSTPFMIGEILLVAAVLFHGANGLRIIVNDLAPHLWQKSTERQSFWRVLFVTVLLWLPAAFAMGRALYLNNLCRCAPAASGLGSEPPPLAANAPLYFLGVFALVLVALFAGLQISENRTLATRQIVPPRKTLETWSWQAMRWSGALLIPLVWLHVLLQDVLVGVHAIDLNYAAARFAMTGWKIFDILLLAFAFGHGVNGLRGIAEDYIHQPRALRLVKLALLLGYAVIMTMGAVAILATTGA